MIDFTGMCSSGSPIAKEEALTVTSVGGNAVIDLGEDGTITLAGVTVKELEGEDFLV